MTMPSSERQNRRYEEHLTDAELNDLLDGTLATSELDRAQRHLASCADCEERYRTLQATVHALQSAPSLLPRRSFQLSPEQAKLAPKKPTLLDRFSEWIVPGVPAIRAATLAIALLLLSVTAIDVITHRSSVQESAGPVAMQQTADQGQAPAVQANNAVATSAPSLQESETEPSTGSSAVQRTENDAAGGASAPESAQENASDSALDSSSVSSAGEAPQAPAPASAVEPTQEIMLGAAPSLSEAPASPTIALAATASPVPPAATPQATPTPASTTAGSGGSISPWRIAELGLLMLLIWLGVSWFGRTRMPEEPTSDSDEDPS